MTDAELRRRRRGSSTLSPPTDSGAAGAPELPLAWALGAGGGVFLLYALTLAPTTVFWDASEYIATAHIMGIPHPPGNPLFVVLARAWEILLSPLGWILPPESSVSVRINLFSAFVSAAAHTFWFLVVHRILTYFPGHRLFPKIGALAAVAVSASAFTVWNHSNVNEKVYTVSLMTIALLSWLVFHWRDNLGKGKDDNLLVLMVFILALSVGNHLMAFLAAPAMGLYILMLHPSSLANWRLYAWGVAAGLVGLSIHLFLPIRSELGPIINEAQPTCATLVSALVSIVSWGQAGCVELSEALSRQQYDKPPLIPRLAPFSSQLLNYFQYFDWQWARGVEGVDRVLPLARLPFTLLFIGLGVFGAVEHFRRDRASWWYIFTLFTTLSLGLVIYLNFRYGYSIPAPEANRDLHEVRERDYFFIVSFSVWGLWAGVGVACLWRRLAMSLGGDGPRAHSAVSSPEVVSPGESSSYNRAWLRSAPIMGLVLLPILLNWQWASRAGDYSARDWAYNVLQSVEPYGVVFTNGDNDTFPLWYLQEVEGLRRDVTVIVTSYLNTPWYARQLRDLTRPCPAGVDPLADPTRIICQRPYEPQGLPAVYTHDPSLLEEGQTAILVDRPVQAPTRSILDLPDETIQEAARAYVQLPQDQSYSVGDGVATLQAGEYLLPWQQFAIAIVTGAIQDRPIYFATTTNAYERLDLSRFLVRQGLAFRVIPQDLESQPMPGVMDMESSFLISVIGPRVDVERTRTLAWEVFHHREGFPESWDFWPDHPTLGIPNYYAWVHYALAQAAAQQDDDATLEVERIRAETWAELGESLR